MGWRGGILTAKCISSLFVSCIFGVRAMSGQGLAGKVVGSDGVPLNGAYVTALGTSKIPWTSAITSAGQGGAFSFASLSPGAYRLCAQAPGTRYLSNCAWSTTPPTASLVAGQSAIGMVITLQRGSILQIEVSDLGGFATPTGGKQAPDLLIGAYTPTGFEPAVVTSKTATGSNHEIVIPFDANVRIVAHSSQLQFALTSGLAVGNDASMSILQPSGSSATLPTLVFQITGVNP